MTNGTGGTSADEDLIFDTMGSGHVINPDNQRLAFGDGKDGTIHYDSSANKIMVNGVPWQWNSGIGITGGMTIDNVAISTNTVATNSGSVLYIDPYPDGLSSDGLVVVKGSLQVDGTTTSVNSTVSTLNDPIMHLGDLTSEKTLMTHALVGVTTLRLDSVVGINTNDVISGSPYIGLSGVGTVTGYDTVNKIVTVNVTVRNPGISTTTQLTVTHAYDTQTDRGISFGYNTSSGTGNNKLGFFGYTDQSSALSSAPDRSWTYVPDANLSNSLITGTRGFLDIKGIYYQTGDFNTNCVVYFDANGLQT